MNQSDPRIGVVANAIGSANTDQAKRVLEALDAYDKKRRASSNLVSHAERELKALGEDPDTIEGMLKVVQAFADMGHSGGSAMVCVPLLNDLLQYKNIRPLTDDPEEWMHVAEEQWGQPGGVWQSKRNPEAFSHDGGKTYYLLSENKRDGTKNIHVSEKKEPT